MKLFVAAALAIAVGWAVVLASPRPHIPRRPARLAKAERICRAQGPNCRMLSRGPTGVGCVCE